MEKHAKWRQIDKNLNRCAPNKNRMTLPRQRARTAINQEEAGHEKQAHIARTTGSALSEPQGVDAIVITSSTSFGALA